ncbi:glycosyltransferase family 4 protein [Aetokthonos hydrillicola Thurmond2011]|jgi:glycosyltransferase involved in cell wall biosynthesis|uniref:Glycosyltransferase family 4 protein n=1 Tax=Aetokthonos hydrillicola Thurmond2011 TaxID=2712845 RepID=A0AAP5I6Y7_9CYAN|nr:glycosyltransferase family 4 protein [Aetokthonos hydrillicola]MBO3460911.1 glycosyltransferase family 4 protein [Aetokthonos hydrillicola CCALA 1050]MBW4586460.1 glycosyltransferase family 4 protein [Aetokthonos hydrillicola CCALA 1050]MDR9893595.1 glycosyltransferase family 4 protein [Aetokthonos hydrillicola Thurmond2011]
MNTPIKIQIVSRDIPIENTIGNATYILDFMRYLRKAGCKIEFVFLNSSPNGRFPWYIIPPAIAELANVSAKDNLRIGRILVRFNPLSNLVAELLRPIYNQLPKMLKNIYRSYRDRRQEKPIYKYGVSSQPWDTLASLEEISFANLRFVKFKPDVVVVNYAFLSDILCSHFLNEKVLKVILTHDVRSQRSAHFKKLNFSTFESYWSVEQEIIALSKAQLLLAIQQEDVNIFKELVPQCDVIRMPISAVCHSHTVKQIAGRCLFVGSATDHNYYGLQWFLENVWPIIVRLIPNCTLHVCGSVCDLIQGTFPNVRFLGRVEDLKPEYSAAEVCLVPLVAGSGLKIKLVEAMSYARACVSTSVGVQGLHEIVDKTVLTADQSEDFALAIHTLLTNPGKRQWMEEQAYRYVTEKLSPQAVYQPFIDYIHQYLQPGSRRTQKVKTKETEDLSNVTSLL